MHPRRLSARARVLPSQYPPGGTPPPTIETQSNNPSPDPLLWLRANNKSNKEESTPIDWTTATPTIGSATSSDMNAENRYNYTAFTESVHTKSQWDSTNNKTCTPYMKKHPFPASPPAQEVPEILDESPTVAGAGNPGPSRVSSNSPDTRSEPSVAPYLPSGSDDTKPATLTSKLKVHEETIRPADGNNKTCSPRSKKAPSPCRPRLGKCRSHPMSPRRLPARGTRDLPGKKSSLPVSPPTREVPESSDESPTVAGTGNPGPSRKHQRQTKDPLNAHPRRTRHHPYL
ncbi:uncharacterized protein LOC131687487 [Topomyia yanbarensis]|uniref:uncharacterized protein LOC131687487 n=1 Tax=Topomyia yanbarensis TaxID=2498891 RepID=UPI00273B5622|nr:uncharacterized protein LOC131687487 [Topomyia yanbarensis]